MKIKIKKFKSISLYILAPVILVLVLIFLIYQSNQRIKFLKQGIDLKPRPFSELIALDFAGIKEEPADPSKCDGTKILKFLSEVKTSTAPVDWFKDYDPNIHKLTILDNCWRQYENEYVKFKFRDLNGSLRMYGANSFSIVEAGKDSSCDFIVKKINKKGKPTSKAIINFFTYSIDKFLGLSIYKNQDSTTIYRANAIHYSYKEEEQPFYFVELENKDEFLYLLSYCNRTTKDILSTIEIKK